jgi:hypothetical protein
MVAAFDDGGPGEGDGCIQAATLSGHPERPPRAATPRGNADDRYATGPIEQPGPRQSAQLRPTAGAAAHAPAAPAPAAPAAHAPAAPADDPTTQPPPRGIAPLR